MTYFQVCDLISEVGQRLLGTRMSICRKMFFMCQNKEPFPDVSQEAILFCFFSLTGPTPSGSIKQTIYRVSYPRLYHGKMCLKVFVVVIPKKDWWLRPHPPILLWVWHRLYNCTLLPSIVGVIPNEGLAPIPPAHQAFFEYDDDKDLKVQFPMTWLMYIHFN